MSAITRDDERLAREADFFDHFYEGESGRFDPAVLERYRTKSRRGLYSKEARIAAIGTVEGKRILDVGCGTGSNSVLLGLLGASVTGLDVSPVAVGKAQQLASNAGVSGNVVFLNEPFEAFEPSELFDIVWVDAFLHHMLPVLDETLAALGALLKPDGRMVIAEPVRTSALVRKLRTFFPENVDATPDERPLESGDLDLIERHLDILYRRYFRGIARLTPMVLGSHSYESASPIRQLCADSIARLDQMLLSLPVVRGTLGGTMVLIGRPKKKSGVGE